MWGARIVLPPLFSWTLRESEIWNLNHICCVLIIRWWLRLKGTSAISAVSLHGRIDTLTQGSIFSLLRCLTKAVTNQARTENVAPPLAGGVNKVTARVLDKQHKNLWGKWKLMADCMTWCCWMWWNKLYLWTGLQLITPMSSGRTCEGKGRASITFGWWCHSNHLCLHYISQKVGAKGPGTRRLPSCPTPRPGSGSRPWQLTSGKIKLGICCEATVLITVRINRFGISINIKVTCQFSEMQLLRFSLSSSLTNSCSGADSWWCNSEGACGWL